MLSSLPAPLRWKVFRFLSQPYLPLRSERDQEGEGGEMPYPPVWCAQCGECIGVGSSPHIGFLCSVHCRTCGCARCMACWQRNPCPHALPAGGIHYSCQCWDEMYCTCGYASFPVMR